MHGNARLTPVGRLTMVLRDRTELARRARGGGDGYLSSDGLQVVEPLARARRPGGPGRSVQSTPCLPTSDPPEVERAIEDLRRALKWGPTIRLSRLRAAAGISDELARFAAHHLPFYKKFHAQRLDVAAWGPMAGS